MVTMETSAVVMTQGYWVVW